MFATNDRNNRATSPAHSRNLSSSFHCRMGNKICVGCCIKDKNDSVESKLHILGVLISKPKFPKLATSAERIVSFNEWPVDSTRQMPCNLAEAGFFYTGVRDIAQCFHCGLHLYDWIPTDIPWKAHARGNPKCDYLRLCKGAAFIKSVNDGEYGYSEKMAVKFDNDENDNSGTFVVDDVKIAELDEKMPSWRGDQHVQHLLDMCFDEKLIAAALITNNYSTFDNLECMLERLERLSNTIKDNEESQDRKTFSIDYLQRSITPSERLCKICMDAEICVVFLPCAHLVCCPTCSPALQQCPICRTEALARIRVYSA